jgi:uncharacterized DUF497 family protein
MERFFEWDGQKADHNFRKHGIQFVDAARVFDDPLAVTAQDRVENFEDEGIEVVRIISARRVDRAERRRYEHG